MGAVVAVFIGVSIITRLILGSDAPRFTEEEAAIWYGLQDRTASLVVREEQISGLPGDWYDCTDPSKTSATVYEKDSAGHVEKFRLTDDTGPARADSDFCLDEGGGWVGSAVALSATKSELLGLSVDYKHLSRGSDEELELVVKSRLDEYGASGTTHDAEWLEATALGNAGYALHFMLRDPESQTDFTYYSFRFVRNVVEAAVVIKVPAGAITDAEATAIAMRFDEKIQREVELLSAEVRGPQP